MAIKATIETIQGLSLTDAYVNISNPQVIKVKTAEGNTYRFSGNACVYASETAYSEGKIPIEGFSVVVDNLDLAQNMFEQAYTVLAENERLSNVTDVI